ncbi:hypothetical protein D8674_005984 [Pyrus ussuriensis x Pyrus communis]|uniref:Uncharacterized protein n=1 Tax=Pyrus ussuriensis x Pyrus communis TaxID=2448454 RepID=A0A5N5FTN7_9ROSA|nr:hypothetical protein D8674_005984 [Pyrus ussuriensis x Pyrus communis]
MNSNFGSFSDSNWGSSSNSKLEDKWAEMRREDEESDEEDEAWSNTSYMVAMARVMACEATEEQPQWGGSIAEGKSPQLDYYVNMRQYNMGYYLADGIYPKWVTLIQAIANPADDAERWFTLHQEAYRKDVKRAFEFDDDQEDPNRLRRARAKIYNGPNLPLNPRTGIISVNKYMRRHRITQVIPVTVGVSSSRDLWLKLEQRFGGSTAPSSHPSTGVCGSESTPSALFSLQFDSWENKSGS